MHSRERLPHRREAMSACGSRSRPRDALVLDPASTRGFGGSRLGSFERAPGRPAAPSRFWKNSCLGRASGDSLLRASDRRDFGVTVMRTKIGGQPRIGRTDGIHQDGGTQRDHQVARRGTEASE